MSGQPAVLYERDGRVARVTLNRPDRANAINAALLRGLVDAIEQADLDREIHVVILTGNGTGFCGGYDLVESAQEMAAPGEDREHGPSGSALDPKVISANHDPAGTWDPMVDYAMMSRNVRAFTSLLQCSKPVICSVHGFCVAGGTDMALCADLLVIADDAKIGYPPARVWGSPTTSLWAYRLGPQRAARLLYTGDSLSGREALEWGLAAEAPPASDLAERTEILAQRIARNPTSQLAMMKLLITQSLYAQGLYTTQVLGTVFDGIARHTPEGYAFQQRAAEAGFRAAVHERDDPFGDAGRSTFKG